MNDRPLISIITPSYNRAGLIGEAVESVLRQEYPGVEHWVIDGGSTDGTLETLRRYPHLQVISEPDRGMYDALNKGLKLAKGEIIGFLNTDDGYLPGALERAVEVFRAHPEVDAVVGSAVGFQGSLPDQMEIKVNYPPIPEDGLWRRVTGEAPIFNAWFFRRSLFDWIGGFDISYRYAADREFLVRLAVKGARFASLAQPVYAYRLHPGSMTLSLERAPAFVYGWENLRIAEGYLHDPATPPEQRKIFREWHSLYALEVYFRAVYHFYVREAWRFWLRGWRYDKAWPLISFRRGIPMIWRYFTRAGKGRQGG